MNIKPSLLLVRQISIYASFMLNYIQNSISDIHIKDYLDTIKDNVETCIHNLL